MDSVPPERIVKLLIAITPAILAAAFAAASWSIGALSGARRVALRDALDGGARRALDRYLEAGPIIEARWLVLRASGTCLSALWVWRELPALGRWGSLLAVLIAVVAYSVPSEIARVLAGRNAESSAPFLMQLLRPFELLAAPIADPVGWLARLITKSSHRSANATPVGVTETEVQLIVNEGEMNGSLGHDQSEMIRNVLDFGDATAGQLMAPRTQVVAFNIDTPIDEVLRKVADTEHSRFPIYRDSIDNIIGVLHAKDLLKHVAGTELDGLRIEKLLRQPVAFVPENQSATSVLKDMRAARQHMAVVIDEFGGFSGIITLEDLLEEIVGDIRDEHDVEEAPIADLGEGRLMVDASVSVTDLSRYLGAVLPEDGDYHTLAGFVVAQLGRVPEVGTRLNAFGLEFTVRDADERRVVKVEIARTSAAESIVPRSSSRMTAA